MLDMTYGVSPEAQQINLARCENFQSKQLSAIFGRYRLLNELSGVNDDCSDENWDGYGAVPVNQRSYDYAINLIQSMPSEIPDPSVGADPDGELTLEWHRSRWKTLSISVSADGHLHFAALFGNEPNGSTSGTIPFFGLFPLELRQLIARVLQK